MIVIGSGSYTALRMHHSIFNNVAVLLWCCRIPSDDEPQPSTEDDGETLKNPLTPAPLPLVFQYYFLQFWTFYSAHVSIFFIFFSILFIVHFYSTTVKKCPFAIVFHTFIVHILYKWCVICYLDSLSPSSTNLSLMPQGWTIRFREFLKPLCSSSNNFVTLRVHCSKGKVGTTAERWAFPNA